MPCRERGVALVTVILLLALLMVLGMMLGEKVIRATRSAAQAGARDQALQAAGAGIETARHLLAANYRDSSGWAACLAAAPDGERYPAVPVWTLTVGRARVELFLRDNPDGDGDPRRDNDLKLFVLARARVDEQAAVLVESLCALDPESIAYRQGGGDARRSGQAAGDGPVEPWTAPVTAFHLKE